MNKQNILQILNQSRIKDYSFTIIFFVIFSFFLFFAIRPNLVTVYSLQSELKSLREMDEDYERVIRNIIQLQSVMMSYQDRFVLLDQAVPHRPQANAIIDNITKAAQAADLTIVKFDIGEVKLKTDTVGKQDKQEFIVNIEADGRFDELTVFMNELIEKRRLKTIETLSIVNESPISTTGALLRIKMEIAGHYL